MHYCLPAGHAELDVPVWNPMIPVTVYCVAAGVSIIICQEDVDCLDSVSLRVTRVD